MSPLDYHQTIYAFSRCTQNVTCLSVKLGYYTQDNQLQSPDCNQAIRFFDRQTHGIVSTGVRKAGNRCCKILLKIDHFATAYVVYYYVLKIVINGIQLPCRETDYANI